MLSNLMLGWSGFGSGMRVSLHCERQRATIAPMQLLTVAQYAKLKKVSPQAVYQKIHRGKLKTVSEKVEIIRIPVEDTELESVQ